MPDGLLEAIKNYLDYTWSDEKLEAKLTGIAQRGMTYLDSMAGVALDYITEAAPRELLLEYCRYSVNGILDQFETNYAPFLIRLSLSNGSFYGRNVE
jgi:hypothetical protein